MTLQPVNVCPFEIDSRRAVSNGESVHPGFTISNLKENQRRKPYRESVQPYPREGGHKAHVLQQPETHIRDHLIAIGENMKFIQKQMGHASITTTINIFGHLLPDASKGVGCRFDQLVFASTP